LLDDESTDEWVLKSALITYLQNAVNSKDKLMIILAEILYDMATTPRPWDNNISEDTHIHSHLAVIITSIFSKDKRLGYKWANTMLEASRCRSTSTADTVTKKTENLVEQLFPDYTSFVCIQGRRFDLVVIEVKTPKQLNHDLEKLGRELKIMLDMLVRARVDNPIVCGIWIDGMMVISGLWLLTPARQQMSVKPINYKSTTRRLRDVGTAGN
ncbi:hypothetical protein EC973_003527, partial [Apophysomyces ossiformis]